MAIPNIVIADELRSVAVGPGASNEVARGQASAVSWGAIVAGAAAAAALSLILLILGTGLGLSSVSPWAYAGIGATTFGVTTILWVTLTQLLASGMGGYISGRLRANWIGTQTDEIYFRDTAHGFLAWAVASLATAALLSSVIGSIVGGGIQAGATVAGGAAATAGSQPTTSPAGPGVTSALAKVDPTSSATSEPTGYYMDSLFRKDVAAGKSQIAGDQESTAAQAEVTRIFMHTIRSGALPAEDARYASQLVAQRTGVILDEAQKRVTETYSRMQAKLQDAEVTARDAADKARKASAYTALWLFISLLIGAFVASYAAVYGGRHRDL